MRLALGIFCALVTVAATTGPSLPAKEISMEAKNVGARDIIKNLLDQSGLKYELPASLTNKKRVNIEAKNATWAKVFEMTLADAGFKYDFDANGVLQLVASPNVK